MTIWITAGSMAAAAGIGTLLGVAHEGAADTTTETTSDASPPASSSGDALEQPARSPGRSDTSGTVTSGGS